MNTKKEIAPSEDRTHDLQITLFNSDYETDALPTALLRLYSSKKIGSPYVIHKKVFFMLLFLKFVYPG